MDTNKGLNTSGNQKYMSLLKSTRPLRDPEFKSIAKLRNILIRHKIKKVEVETDSDKRISLIWTLFYKDGRVESCCLDADYPVMQEIREMPSLPFVYLIDNSRVFHYGENHLFNLKKREDFPGYCRNPKEENIQLKNWCDGLWNHLITFENMGSYVSVVVNYGDLVEERMKITKGKMVQTTTHELVEQLTDPDTTKPLVKTAPRRPKDNSRKSRDSDLVI